MLPKSALIGVVLTLGHPMPAYCHDLYSHLVDAFGGSCCDNVDCRPAPYRFTATGVLMQVYGYWIELPSETIQYRALPGDDGKTGGGHWCGRIYQPGTGVVLMTRCAVLPPQAASSTPRADDLHRFGQWP